MTIFTAFRDADYGYVVCDASVKARSFALVPVGHPFIFETASEAVEQAKRLSSAEIRTRMIETPDRFEEVANTLYGSAW